jgi:uncharacterized repeat protein (TIGR03803 family)
MSFASRIGKFALVAIVLLLDGVIDRIADAASLMTLWNFCSEGAPCKNGYGPQAAVVMDKAGNLYGTTNEGGAYGAGEVYELSPSGTTWAFTVLHSFCQPPLQNNICVDGAAPFDRLIIDTSGNLYGTTYESGQHGGGTVFELSPNATSTKWTLTPLYEFGSQAGDGIKPRAGLIMDAGHLYGTTVGGGKYGQGTVFKLTPPSGSQTGWAEKVLYSFGTNGGANDGNGPYAGLISDVNGSGKLYGTTVVGGLYGYGTVFALTPPSGTETAWTESILWDFCAKTKCADGSEPYASLLMDAARNLYGTTYAGGAGYGLVFELSPNAGKTPWKQTVLYTFCSKAVCRDGGGPMAEAIADGAGNLYGTTIDGGEKLSGAIFKLTPPAAGKTVWTETLPWSFCTDAQGTACLDGQAPYSGLIMDKSGNLYGTTDAGGKYSAGTVFEY